MTDTTYIASLKLVAAGTSSALAIYSQSGLVKAWERAIEHAGPTGRIATLPDIIAARLARECNAHSPAWERCFTTSSTEYMGIGASGRRILIVAHGIGPLGTIGGVRNAYSHRLNEKDPNRAGGRISRKQFLDLERGVYGQVSIIDFEKYTARYDYPHAIPFAETLKLREIVTDPLIAARLGPQWREYAERHLAESMAYMTAYNRETSGDSKTRDDLGIIELNDASNSSYRHCELHDEEAFAHLIQIGQLVHSTLCDSGEAPYESLTSRVSLFEWNTCARVAAVRGRAATEHQPALDGVKC